MLTALVFLIILLSAVLVHELAHYLNARSVGLPVRAFSVGMGPVLFRHTWRGTEWRFSLFPIGGYVDLPGMAPTVDADGNLQHPTGGMAEKPLSQKLWVLLGGVIANFLLGVVLITGRHPDRPRLSSDHVERDTDRGGGRDRRRHPRIGSSGGGAAGR